MLWPEIGNPNQRSGNARIVDSMYSFAAERSYFSKHGYGRECSSSRRPTKQHEARGFSSTNSSLHLEHQSVRIFCP